MRSSFTIRALEALSAAAIVAAITVAAPSPALSQATLLGCPGGGYGTNITASLAGSYSPLDDGTVHIADVSTIFPDGIYFAGTGLGDTFYEMYINANGNITFTVANPTYTPDFIPFEETTPFPIIAPWYSDVDFRSGGGSLWYCEDVPGNRIIVTWDSVGFYNQNHSVTNSFQVVLTNPGSACGASTGLDVEYRYNSLNWYVGTASGGAAGLCPDPFNPPWDGGTGTCYPAVAGIDIGNGLYAVRLPESGFPDILDVTTLSNTGEDGVWEWTLVNTCGNGTTDPCEECDDANYDNEDSCINLCMGNICGDGYVNYEGDAEVCDGTDLGLLIDNSCAAYDPVIFDAGYIRCADTCDAYDYSNCTGPFQRCYSDEDGDGWTGTEQVISSSEDCADYDTGGFPWETVDEDDCLDSLLNPCSAESFPGNPEVCDTCDNDCDGLTDDDDPDIGAGDPATIGAVVFYPDTDGDSCGDPAGATIHACDPTAPAGYAANALDVDDTDGACCGNSVPEAGEECDDGNFVDDDGCTACVLDYCGDGFINDGGAEACDDGNSFPGDGCSAACAVENGYDCTGEPSVCVSTCGDGFVAADEGCDDGDTVDGDGCSAACEEEWGYDCAGEPSVCASTCGDGEIASDEECDDAGTVPGDGCSDSCDIEHGYECIGEPSVCASTCGDGFVASDEECDDGGLAPDDGCDDLCEEEPGWECDASEPSLCDTVCGDTIVAGDEECDDGGTVSDDGCSDVCLDEDWDDDGVWNDLEIAAGMDPYDPDSDDDNIGDGDEYGPLATGPVNTDGTDEIDALDTDSDNDGLLDIDEAGDADLWTDPIDTDGNGDPNYQDPDSDDDGVLDGVDNCYLVPNPDQEDLDDNGVGDACDDDADGDGIPNDVEIAAGMNPYNPDSDGDSIGDGPIRSTPTATATPTIRTRTPTTTGSSMGCTTATTGPTPTRTTPTSTGWGTPATTRETPARTAPRTPTPRPTRTPTPMPTRTATRTPTRTRTAARTAPPTRTATPTATPIPTRTATPIPTRTATPIPTRTATPIPTRTATPIPTRTATASTARRAACPPAAAPRPERRAAASGSWRSWRWWSADPPLHTPLLLVIHAARCCTSRTSPTASEGARCSREPRPTSPRESTSAWWGRTARGRRRSSAW